MGNARKRQAAGSGDGWWLASGNPLPKTVGHHLPKMAGNRLLKTTGNRLLKTAGTVLLKVSGYISLKDDSARVTSGLIERGCGRFLRAPSHC